MFNFRILFGKEKTQLRQRRFKFAGFMPKSIGENRLMLTRCFNCNFYVSSFESKCPNCGRLASPRKIVGGYLQIAKFPALFALFFSLVFSLPATIFFFGDFDNFAQILLSAAFIYSIFFAVLFFIQFKRSFISRANNEINSPVSSIAGKRKLIEKRIAELDSRGRKIDSVLDKIKETDRENLQEARRKLLSAREIVISQLARYELQKQKVELVRLQNELSPYLYKLHRLADVETESGLAAVEITQLEIENMRGNLASYAAIDFPEKTLPEKQSFLAQLDETNESCERLREALLGRQAASALRGISPIEGNLKFSGAKEVEHAAETFNMRAALTDFSESFDELESEYRRLRSESETNKNLFDE